MPKPKKILIIENEKVLREMYVVRFKQAGLEVIAVDNAEDGVRVARQEQPDIVLLDILLPRNDGLKALQEIREDPTIAKLKIVAFSNFDDPTAKKHAKELKALDYLIKTNFTPAEIVKKVKSYLK